MNTAPRTGKCPPLDPDRKHIADYRATGREPGYDGNPPQFEMRREFPWVDGRREPTESNFNVNHSRLCFLFNNRRLEERQYLAGERLARDYESSKTPPRSNSVIVGNGASGGNSSSDALQRKIDAGGRYDAAVRALGRGASA